MSLIEKIRQELIAILKLKEKDLLTTDPSLVDYPILTEEIADAKYAIGVIQNNNTSETEKMSLLLGTFHTTTSGRIYDSLGKLFPSQHIKTKPLDILIHNERGE